jgi:iron transport multicopper oxidase
VALVFSCVSGILGVAVVAWYGFAGEVREESGKGVLGAAQGGKEVQAAAVHGEGKGEKSGDAAAGCVGGDEDGDRGRER